MIVHIIAGMVTVMMSILAENAMASDHNIAADKQIGLTVTSP